LRRTHPWPIGYRRPDPAQAYWHQDGRAISLAI
jgi:hypothetical protein